MQTHRIYTPVRAGNIVFITNVYRCMGVFPLSTEQVVKALYAFSIIYMTVAICGNLATSIDAVAQHAVGYNSGAFVVSIFAPLWQGGLLIGVTKIIEILNSKRN